MSACVSLRIRDGRPLGWLYSAAGAFVLLALWQGAVQSGHSGNGTIPSPTEIVAQFWSDGPWFYLLSASHTLRSAALGWMFGNALAVALALAAVAAPALARPILQLGIVSFCLPLVAIGPVLTLLFEGDVPRIALAALTVFFTTLVGTLIGLRGADPVMLDLVRGFGGGRRDQLIKVRLRAALPSLFAALRIASPSAILGAMIAEFLGAENGLGVVLINSQQGLNYSRTWAVAAFATCVAGAAYALTSLVGRAITPWARETATNIAASVLYTPPVAGRRMSERALRIVASAALSTLLILLVWELLLWGLAVSPFIGKGPVDVFLWLTDPQTGADNVAAISGEALISLRDAAIGLIAGSCAAVLTAIAFTLWPPLHRTFIGPSLALQSVPLIAVTPVIVLIFGRDLLAIAVVGGLVAFFPTLVNVSLALSRTPRQALDLVHVYGASRFATLWKVQLPAALPALFASLRIAAPLSMTGAMLAEWLATGQGLGYAMLSASAQSDYDGLWARVALATGFSFAIYKLIGVAEQVALGRFAQG